MLVRCLMLVCCRFDVDLLSACCWLLSICCCRFFVGVLVVCCRFIVGLLWLCYVLSLLVCFSVRELRFETLSLSPPLSPPSLSPPLSLSPSLSPPLSPSLIRSLCLCLLPCSLLSLNGEIEPKKNTLSSSVAVIAIIKISQASLTLFVLFQNVCLSIF